jgi:hypothetical protein
MSSSLPEVDGAVGEGMRLIVPEGTYEALTLAGVLWLVLKHRTWHFIQGDGFVD